MAGAERERGARAIRPVEQALAACAGSVMTSVLTTPLEVIKVRQQAMASGSMAALAARISREEGIFALWTGLRATILMNVPAQVIYMGAYERASKELRQSPGLELWAPMIAGGGSRLISSSIVSPIELLRTRLQAQAPSASSPSLLSLASSVVSAEGVSGLWRGLVPTLWRDVPFSCLYWLCYEHLKQRAVETHPEQRLTGSGAFICGAAAGGAAALVTTPLDVIKTRQQLAARTGTGGGTITTLQHVLRTEGLRGFFAGLAPRLAKTPPACAVMITSYELGKIVFARWEPARWMAFTWPSSRGSPAASFTQPRATRRPTVIRRESCFCEGASMSACGR
jgi:solute carrier family 25 protein 39/40